MSITTSPYAVLSKEHYFSTISTPFYIFYNIYTFQNIYAFYFFYILYNIYRFYTFYIEGIVSVESIESTHIGGFGERKLLYKFGTVQAIKYNPCN